jgi:hypothetical protein
MLRYVKWVGLISLLALTSCTYIRNSGVIQDRDTDYLKARSIPPLRIPPGLSSSTIEAHYPVSEASYPISTKPVDLTPPGLNSPMVRTTAPAVSEQRTKALEMSNREEVELEMATRNIIPKTELAQTAKPATVAIPTQIVPAPVVALQTPAKPAPQIIAVAAKPNPQPSTTEKVSSALKSIWPWGKKSATTATTSVAQASQPTSVVASHKTTGMLDKLNSVWPWKKTTQAS